MFGSDGEGPKEGRISHSSISYGRSLFIYGGEKKYSDKEHKRDCYADMWIFDTQKNIWRE